MATARAKPPKAPRRSRFALRPYGRRHANSGVVAYASGAGFIAVQFRSGDIYVYTNASSGRQHVTAMKRHAKSGSGLSAYISRNTHDTYARVIQRIELPRR